MDRSDVLTYLNAHIGAGMKPGLERIRALLEAMGDPQVGYPSIHVAGTNGKTSTTRFGAVVLVAHGLSTGTYTSPHLEHVEDRFGINGRVATTDELVQAMADVAAFADLLEERTEHRFSYFELTTAMAFAFFADQAVEAAVVEVGLGGRLDATNVIDAEVCVLTGVGLDHTDYLGGRVEDIAAEKLAIAGPSSILVTGPLSETVGELAEATARSLGIEHRAFGRDFGVEAERAVGGWLCQLRGAEADYPDVHLPVHGRHQAHNTAVAVAACEALLGRSLDPEAVVDAAATFTSPGRLEPVGARPLVLLDGAHNPDGFAALGAALAEEFARIRFVLVLGVMGDKDLESMLPSIQTQLVAVVATAVDEERAVAPAEVARRAEAVVDVPVEWVAEPAAAVWRAKALAGDSGAVLVAGSLYLVGAVRGALAS